MTDISWLRRDAELSRPAAAALCGVSLRTWQRWESGTTDCPLAVVRLLQMLGGDLCPIGWDGWVFRRGQLWSPEMPAHRAGLKPAQVRAGHWLLLQADYRTYRTLLDRAGRTPAANLSDAGSSSFASSYGSSS